jgi:hypothetical protein
MPLRSGLNLANAIPWRHYLLCEWHQLFGASSGQWTRPFQPDEKSPEDLISSELGPKCPIGRTVWFLIRSRCVLHAWDHKRILIFVVILDGR